MFKIENGSIKCEVVLMSKKKKSEKPEAKPSVVLNRQALNKHCTRQPVLQCGSLAF